MSENNKVEWVDLFRRTTELVSSTLDLAALEREILEFMKKLLGAEAASLLLRDEETGELIFTIALGEAGSAVETIRLPPGEGIAGWVAENNKSLCVEDAAVDPRFCRKVDDDTAFVTRSVLAVPLRAAGRVIGVLEAINRVGGGSFSGKQLMVLEALSGLVAVAVDHARRIAEVNEYSRGLERMVEKRTDELRWAQAKLLHAKKMAGIGKLGAGIAHEINNPLSYVISNMTQLGEYSSLLGAMASEAEKIIARIPGGEAEAWSENFKKNDAEFVCSDIKALVMDCTEGLERIASVVARLKEFSGVNRNCAGKVNLGECVNDALKRLTIPEGVRIDFVSTDAPTLWAEPERLSQAIANCLENALAALENTINPKIEIALRSESREGLEGATIVIVDNGCGIDEETAERAFEPFFTTKTVGKGAGLGLSEVYAIVADYRGETRIGRNSGGNTEVELWIPNNRA